MKDITHIERSNLPWHDETLTECGLDASRHPTWTRDEATAKARELGAQRFSLFVCMTCKHTASRHSTWADDPGSCLGRYTSKHTGSWRRQDEGSVRFNYELRAIGLLIEEHRGEFDHLVADLASTSSLSAARLKRRTS